MAPKYKELPKKLSWAPTRAARAKWLKDNKIQYIDQLSAKTLNMLYDQAGAPRGETSIQHNMAKFYDEVLKNHLKYKPGQKNKGKFAANLVTETVNAYLQQSDSDIEGDQNNKYKNTHGDGSSQSGSEDHSTVDSSDSGDAPVPSVSSDSFGKSQAASNWPHKQPLQTNATNLHDMEVPPTERDEFPSTFDPELKEDWEAFRQSHNQPSGRLRDAEDRAVEAKAKINLASYASAVEKKKSELDHVQARLKDLEAASVQAKEHIDNQKLELVKIERIGVKSKRDLEFCNNTIKLKNSELVRIQDQVKSEKRCLAEVQKQLTVQQPELVKIEHEAQNAKSSLESYSNQVEVKKAELASLDKAKEQTLQNKKLELSKVEQTLQAETQKLEDRTLQLTKIGDVDKELKAQKLALEGVNHALNAKKEELNRVLKKLEQQAAATACNSTDAPPPLPDFFVPAPLMDLINTVKSLGDDNIDSSFEAILASYVLNDKTTDKIKKYLKKAEKSLVEKRDLVKGAEFLRTAVEKVWNECEEFVEIMEKEGITKLG